MSSLNMVLPSQDELKKQYLEKMNADFEKYLDSCKTEEERTIVMQMIKNINDINKATEMMGMIPGSIQSEVGIMQGMADEAKRQEEANKTIPPADLPPQGLGGGMGIMGDCCPPVGGSGLGSLSKILEAAMPQLVPILGDKILNKFKAEPGIIQIRYKTNDDRFVNQSEFDIKIGDPKMIPIITQIVQTFQEHATEENRLAEEARKKNVDIFSSKQKKKYKKRAKKVVSNPDTVSSDAESLGNSTA